MLLKFRKSITNYYTIITRQPLKFPITNFPQSNLFKKMSHRSVSPSQTRSPQIFLLIRIQNDKESSVNHPRPRIRWNSRSIKKRGRGNPVEENRGEHSSSRFVSSAEMKIANRHCGWFSRKRGETNSPPLASLFPPLTAKVYDNDFATRCSVS